MENPKEEQKQHIINIMKSDEELGLYEQTKCYCGHTTTCDCGPKEEPKQIYYNTVGRENSVNVIKGQFNTQKEALDLANELNEKCLGVYYDWRETLVKEEHKQETVVNEKCFKCGNSQYKIGTPFCTDEFCNKYFYQEPKQETLEEAAERLQKDKYGIFISKDSDVKGQLVIDTAKAAFLSGMNEGAKWQQEHSYSKEELKNFALQAVLFVGNDWDSSNIMGKFNKWFEQFKNK
jgi:hypothetical protein